MRRSALAASSPMTWTEAKSNRTSMGIARYQARNNDIANLTIVEVTAAW